jgi:hypothetical protein
MSDSTYSLLLLAFIPLAMFMAGWACAHWNDGKKNGE